jgi:hypothetical protein
MEKPPPAVTNNNGSSTIGKIAESSYLGARQMIIVFLLGHPLDLAKTKSQSNPSKVYSVNILKQLVLTDGIRGCYRGGSMNFSRLVLKEAYRSPLRGFIKQFYESTLPARFNSQFPDAKNVFTGLTMAMTDTFVLCPLERIKVWIMTTEQGQSASLSRYFRPDNSTLKSFRFTDLFCGLSVSFYRSAISWVSFLVIEENIRKLILAKRGNLNDTPTLSEQVLIGTLCGVLNSIITLPLDAVKTRIQMRSVGETSEQLRIVQTFKYLVRTHGVRGLYAGFQYKLPHYIIVAILTSGNIQRIDKIWRGSSNEK